MKKLILSSSISVAITLISPIPFMTTAFAKDCRGLTEPDLHDCILRKGYEVHNSNIKHQEECDRGGCGPKAKQIQRDTDDIVREMAHPPEGPEHFSPVKPSSK
jgi:hypothetical protein